MLTPLQCARTTKLEGEKLGQSERHVQSLLGLPTIHMSTSPTVADQVFDALRRNILELDLPPMTKMSETEVAGQMAVSRQPVREAFKRLAKLGFLDIRPQRSTTVSLISEDAILRAKFVRTALEVHTIRRACTQMDSTDHTALSAIIEKQKEAFFADDKARFHQLDDDFHAEICNRAGVGYVWDLIKDSKGHMDRVRMLSLTSPSQKVALDEHVGILAMLIKANVEGAMQSVTAHLDRILELIDRVKSQNHQWFVSETR